MCSFVIVFFISLLACKFKQDGSVIALFLFVLPLHYFLKQICFWTGEIGLFPVWRESILIILLFRCRKHYHLPINRYYLALVALIIINTIPYFLVSYQTLERAIGDLRDSITVFVFFFLCSSVCFSLSDIKRIFISQVLVYSFLVFSGILQMFVMSAPIHLFMGHYDLNGFDFLTNSYTIMGVERMCGFSVGPNIFGVCLAIFELCIIIHGINMKVKYRIWNKKILLLSAFFLIAILFTFCRTAWAILVGAIVIVSLMLRKRINLLKFIVNGSISLLLILYITSFMSESVSEVIVSTFSGKEDSSADRTNNVSDAWDVVFSSPGGHGLSSGIVFDDFVTESGWAIYAYEVGVLGLILFLFTFFFILIHIYKMKRYAFVTIGFPICLVSMLAAFPSLGPMYMPENYMIWGLLGLAVNKSFCASYERL